MDTAIHTKLLLLLQGNVEKGDQLSQFFDEVMQGKPENKSRIEKRYGEYLAMLYIYKVFSSLILFLHTLEKKLSRISVWKRPELVVLSDIIKNVVVKSEL